jgi:hypothetical protein
MVKSVKMKLRKTLRPCITTKAISEFLKLNPSVVNPNELYASQSTKLEKKANVQTLNILANPLSIPASPSVFKA